MKQNLIFIVVCAMCAIGCGASKQAVTSPASKNALTDGARKKMESTFYNANQARLQKDLGRAKKEYLETIEQDPTNDAAYYYYAKIRSNEGAYKDALPYIKKATELAPSNKYYQELYADVLAGSGAYAKAIGAYKTLATTDPKMAEKYLRKAVHYQTELRMDDDALQTFAELEKFYGFDEERAYKKIAILKKQKKFAEVLVEVDKLIAEEPSDLKYHLFKITAYEDAKDAIKAKEYFSFVEKKFADNPTLLPYITLKAFDNKDTTKYVSLLEQSIAHQGIETQEKIGLLAPMLLMQKSDSAWKPKLQNYAKTIASNSNDDAQAVQFYGSLLATNGQYAKAAEQYTILLKKDAKQFEHWQQLFFLYSQLENYDSLIAITKRAQDYFPSNAMVYYMNGAGHQQKQNLPLAIKAYNKAIDYAGNNKDMLAQVHSALGDLYQTQKEYSKSDANFKTALSYDADNASTLNNYAYFLSLRSENLEEAATMSRKSLVLRKGEKTFLDTYAWILFKQTKYIEAEKIMKDALDAPGDNDATMLEHYGDIQSKLGDAQTAKKYWLQAKQKGSKSETLEKKLASGVYVE
jgi:tetratricopeptide (TPR) repeat protein